MTGQPLGSSRNKVLKMSLKKLGWYLQARSQSGLKFTSRICGCITRFPDGTEAQPVSLQGGGCWGLRGFSGGRPGLKPALVGGRLGPPPAPGVPRATTPRSDVWFSGMLGPLSSHAGSLSP